MDFSYKPGGGNKMQPYVPKGHGDSSGEYTDNSSQFNEMNCLNNKRDNAFLEKNHCTLEDLSKILSNEEISSVVSYSYYRTGTKLNKRIRENTMTDSDIILCERIESAISKNKLCDDLQVFRGISVNQETFNKVFVSAFENNVVISGSRICSTSRDMDRALLGAISGEKNNIPIVFSCKIEKGRSALPIEAIAVNFSEREVLLNCPMYYIKSIDKITIKGKKVYKIEIELMRY